MIMYVCIIQNVVNLSMMLRTVTNINSLFGFFVVAYFESICSNLATGNIQSENIA